MISNILTKKVAIKLWSRNMKLIIIITEIQIAIFYSLLNKYWHTGIDNKESKIASFSSWENSPDTRNLAILLLFFPHMSYRPGNDCYSWILYFRHPSGWAKVPFHKLTVNISPMHNHPGLIVQICTLPDWTCTNLYQFVRHQDCTNLYTSIPICTLSPDCTKFVQSCMTAASILGFWSILLLRGVGSTEIVRGRTGMSTS